VFRKTGYTAKGSRAWVDVQLSSTSGESKTRTEKNSTKYLCNYPGLSQLAQSKTEKLGGNDDDAWDELDTVSGRIQGGSD
jgi:hypothetical protein